MTRLGAGIAAIALLVAACGGSSSAGDVDPPKVTTEPALSARISLVYPNLIALTGEVLGSDEGSCETTGGKYEPIRDGAQITVLDAAGTTVATAKLEAQDNVNAAGEICAWSAEAEGIPAGGGFYRAKIGDFTSDAVAEADLATKGLSIQP